MTEGAADQPSGRGASTLQSEATVEFLLRLRSRGIRNLDVLRAIEQVPRSAFVPHRYADLALRDVALPLDCGQTIPDAFALARMIEALALRPEHRVLEIGTGSGYATAVIAKLARHVLSIERFQSLAVAARMRLASLNLDNVEIVWGDGKNLPTDIGLFDRIFAEAEIGEIPPGWDAALARDGILVAARRTSATPPRQHVVRLSRAPAGKLAETKILPTRLQTLLDGSALAL